MPFNHAAILTKYNYQEAWESVESCKYYRQLKKKKALEEYLKDSKENALRPLHHETLSNKLASTKN